MAGVCSENQLLLENSGTNSPQTAVNIVRDDQNQIHSGPVVESEIQSQQNAHFDVTNRASGNAQALDFLAKYLLMLKMPSFLDNLRLYSIVGFLTIPMTVSYAGLAFGAIAIFVLGAVCIHCNRLILQSHYRLFRGRNKLCEEPEKSFDFVSIVEKAVEYGPVKFQKFGRFAKCATCSWVQMTRFLLCCVAYGFLAASVRQMVVVENGSTSIGYQGYKSIILPVVLFINATQQSGFLDVASSVTDYVMFVALIITFLETLPGPYSTSVVPYVTASPLLNFPVFFGCIMYIFEVTSMVLPIRYGRARDAARRSEQLTEDTEGTEQPEDTASSTTSVYSTNLRIVYFMYAFLGFFGYLQHGEDVEPSISFNLPKSWFAQIGRGAFIWVLFNEYTQQMDMLVKEFSIKEGFSKQVLQITFILLNYGLTMLLPYMDQLVCFIGAFCVTPLVLVIPPILEILTTWNYNNGERRWKILMYIKDVLLILFGITGIVSGIYGVVTGNFRALVLPD